MQKKVTKLILACAALVLALSFLGCRQEAETSNTQNDFNIGETSDSRVEVSITPVNDKTLSLYIGNTKWASGLIKENKTTLAVLELSDQIKLEDGTLGYGIVFARDGSKQFLAIVPDGVIPYGKVVIREVDAIAQTADKLIVADLEAANGTKHPISLKLE
jgi:hypothetical protein